MTRPEVSFHNHAPAGNDFRQDVIRGLSNSPRRIPPKYFYDEKGSLLFDDICRQPEYYLTRTETRILEQNAADIASHINDECILIELGSGASEKVRLLFDSLKPNRYLGVDISCDFLLQSTRGLAREYDWLDVHAICTDYSTKLELPEHGMDLQRVAFFPGSSIGNFEPDEAIVLLERIHRAVGVGGKLIIGIDMEKDAEVLDAAYNDKAGITAAFNMNLVTRMKQELDADIDESAFVHQAFYNGMDGRVEMHLVSTVRQTVAIDEHKFQFMTGDSIHTENSYKYSVEKFTKMAHHSGFEVEKTWQDGRQYFSVMLLEAV